MPWQVKEVEDRFREQEQRRQHTHYSVDAVKATPDEGKNKSCTNQEECPREIEPRVLMSSNSVNRQISQDSASLGLKGGNDSVNEMRSKREFRSIETENNNFVDNRKVMRKSDPPRVGRVGRATRPVAAATQVAPLTHKRVSNQVQGIKERENKKKIWSR